MRFLLTSVLLICSIGLSQAQQPSWKIPDNAPLLTRWAGDVDPGHVLPEYPRPQMARADWMNLNGLWEWSRATDSEAPPVGKTLPQMILVPFPIESALSGVMEHADHLWYRRTFSIPESWKGRHVLLNFGAVDWESVVYVNGVAIGAHRGGYDSFSFDITDALTDSGPQELIVGVSDPTDAGDQARGKQVINPHSIWYTPTTGIWQTVWLEPVQENHVSDLLIVPEPEANRIRLKVSSSQSTGSVQVVLAANGKRVGTAAGSPGEELTIPVRAPKLWSPASPFLYDLTVELKTHGTLVDKVNSYIGMRTVAVQRDSAGIERIFLNGKPVMLVGPLDQGFWPDGIYTAPTDEALRYDIEMTKQLGFNMTRKHVKVEPDRWYYWADKLGLLVWQDMPSANNKTMSGRMQFEQELKRLVFTHRNHPSIMMWVVFNEGWGQYDTRRLTAWVKQLDPSRLVNNASGWTDKQAGDVLDIHNYPTPQAPGLDSLRAAVLGEFGGLGLALEGHTWKKEHWGYQGMKNREQLTRKYETFMKRVYDLNRTKGLAAAVYTQITDVEIECNGLMTYDRDVVKPDLSRIAAVNKGDFSLMPPPPVLRVVLPTSREHPQQWRYTFDQPGDQWINKDFADSTWKSGPGGFGTEKTPGAVIGTVWNTSDIWMRRTFIIGNENPDSLALLMHHDEDAEVYLNGALAAGEEGWTTEYELTPLGKKARASLKKGTNVIAIHCHQTNGGQYIDAGLVEIMSIGKK